MSAKSTTKKGWFTQRKYLIAPKLSVSARLVLTLARLDFGSARLDLLRQAQHKCFDRFSINFDADNFGLDAEVCDLLSFTLRPCVRG